ncbi:MAG: GDSL-type esterase/lipase family protein [Planctomycetota bacterium]
MSSLPEEPLRIACVGASLTFGLGLPNRRETCYPAVLQQLLDAEYGAGRARVGNFGYSGATASRGSNEPYWDTPSFTSVTRFDPRLVVLMLGTNDAQFANATARQTLANDLTDLIRYFQDLGAEVLVGDPPPAFPPVPEIDFDALKSTVRPTIHRVADELDLTRIDFNTPLADRHEDFPDGLHPNADVAAEIAQIAFTAIRGRQAARGWIPEH